MSEDDSRPSGVGGSAHLPETISVVEQAVMAGKPVMLPTGVADALRAYCKTVLDSLGGDPKGHALMLARTKMDEMVFWVRAHLAHRRDP